MERYSNSKLFFEKQKKYDRLRSYIFELDFKTTSKELDENYNITDELIEQFFNILWQKSKTKYGKDKIQDFFYLFAEKGINPLCNENSLTMFINNSSSLCDSSKWNEIFYNLSKQYKWQTRNGGNYLHYICKNGFFVINSIKEVIPKSNFKEYDIKDKNGNTPWHYFWNNRSLRLIGHAEKQYSITYNNIMEINDLFFYNKYNSLVKNNKNRTVYEEMENSIKKINDFYFIPDSSFKIKLEEILANFSKKQIYVSLLEEDSGKTEGEGEGNSSFEDLLLSNYKKEKRKI